MVHPPFLFKISFWILIESKTPFLGMKNLFWDPKIFSSKQNFFLFFSLFSFFFKTGKKKERKQMDFQWMLNKWLQVEGVRILERTSPFWVPTITFIFSASQVRVLQKSILSLSSAASSSQRFSSSSSSSSSLRNKSRLQSSFDMIEAWATLTSALMSIPAAVCGPAYQFSNMRNFSLSTPHLREYWSQRRRRLRPWLCVFSFLNCLSNLLVLGTKMWAWHRKGQSPTPILSVRLFLVVVNVQLLFKMMVLKVLEDIP